MADKWIQLMSENGVDNLYPTSKMDLLWENASPTTSFSAQTISLDLSDYSLVYIIFRSVSDQDKYIPFLNLINGLTYIANGLFNTGQRWTRYYTVNSNGIVFDKGYSEGSESNTRLVPYKIYGIK